MQCSIAPHVSLIARNQCEISMHAYIDIKQVLIPDSLRAKKSEYNRRRNNAYIDIREREVNQRFFRYVRSAWL